ncbi:hypothetical protein BHYA_0079g00180 [Botrytis hyacinthi]|uniref:Uncharacterized protein n=1 Tax=Botrytis hyacinthi TaxID=278943 RepID=A0A4Z1GY47_9HELO|nr:hypothetical protein BHYA_0079g00180 [Botrytis hyacinthi]
MPQIAISSSDEGSSNLESAEPLEGEAKCLLQVGNSFESLRIGVVVLF